MTRQIDRLTHQLDGVPEWVWLTLILGIALFLRVIFPGWTEFKADEARLLSLSWEMAEGTRFPLRGISSSVGLPNFPAAVWVYALPLAVWPHVFSPTIFTGILNTLAVGGCYWFVRRHWGKSAAIVAALLFAISPWAIIHSRKIWAQNLTPIFAMGWLITADLALIEKRSRWLWFHFLLGFFAFQIHLAAVSLVVGSAILLVVYRKTVVWRDVVVGGVVAVLSAGPFIYYVVTRWGMISAGIDSLVNSEGSSGGFSFNAISHSVRLMTGWQMHALAGPTAFESFLNSVPWNGWIIGLWLGLALWGVISAVRTPKPATGMLFTLAFVPLLTFTWFPTEVELHYLLPTFAAWFMLAGIGLVSLLEPLKFWAWVGTIASAGVQISLWWTLFAFLNQTHTPGGYGTPLVFQLDAAGAALQLMEDPNVLEILVVGTGEDPQIDEFAAVYDLHLRDVPHRFVDLDQNAVFTTHDAGLIFAPETAEMSLMARYAAVAQPVSRIDLRDSEEGRLLVLHLPEDRLPEPERRLSPAVLFANWVTLIGHDQLTKEGEWVLHWSVGESRTDITYHFFNHLYTSSAERVSQADAATFSAAQWQPGDRVLSRFMIDIPAEDTRPWAMDTGLYIFQTGERVPYLDAAANPAGESIAIPIPE